VPGWHPGKTFTSTKRSNVIRYCAISAYPIDNRSPDTTARMTRGEGVYARIELTFRYDGPNQSDSNTLLALTHNRPLSAAASLLVFPIAA
jgi:hypothetical protein